MARYDAQINLLVSGQRELERLADRLRLIEKQIVDINRLGVKPQQRDPITGRFGADPDRQNRIRLAGMQRIARDEERRSRLTSGRLRSQNNELERSILLQSRLNSAVDLYERKLEQLSRGGGGAKLSQNLKEQINDIKTAYEVATAGGTKNLSLVRSLATELGRIVERQNEINRASSLGSKGFFKSQEFERRISGLREAGAPISSFGAIGRQMSQYRSAVRRGNQPEAEDAARRITEGLNRITRELNQSFAEFKKQDTARRAARSWQTFFEDAAYQSLQIKESAKSTSNSWKNFFEDAANQALAVKQNAKETKNKWQAFFEDAAYQALAIKQNAKDTSQKWKQFFEDAVYQALEIKQNAKETKERWKEFFENATYQALEIKQNAKETKQSWQLFFDDAAQQAFAIKQNAKQTRLAWEQFFEDARQQASVYRRRPVASMTPQQRVAGEILDPGSLRADRLRRITEGRARQESNRRAISEGLIGGAFPLLFGQGAGAALGGGAGGAIGGFAGGGLGFGLSLVGTALGAAFDTAVQSAKDLGLALDKPVENFDKLAERSFFSSKALETQIKKTIEYGDTATASALIQEEAIKKLGVGGVRNLKELASESDQLGRALSELGENMLAVIAGPLADFTRALNNLFQPKAQAQRIENLRSQLNPQDRASLNKELISIGGFGSSRFGAQKQGLNAVEIEFAARKAPEQVQKILDKYGPLAIKGQIKIDPKQQIESQLNAVQKNLESLDISKGLRDQVRSVAREQQDLDKQRAEIIRSYEESIADIRKRVETEIANRRFAVLEKENELLDLQGQNKLKQLQILNQNIIASAGAGQRPEVEQAAKQAAEIVSQFTEQQLSAEEEAAKIKRKAALDALKIDFQATEFKASIEKEVSRLNIDTARRVADINEQVKRRNEEFDKNRFSLEKKIAELQLKANEIEAKRQLKTAQQSFESAAKSGDANLAQGLKTYVDLYQAQLDIINQGQADIASISAPSGLRGVGAVGGAGVSTAGIDQALAAEKVAIRDLTTEALESVDLLSREGLQTFRNKMNDLFKGIQAPIEAINTSILDADKERIRLLELIKGGMSQTAAARVIEIEQATRLAILQSDAIINELEKRKAIEGTTETIRNQLDAEIQGIKDKQRALVERVGEVSANGTAGTGIIGQAIQSERGRKIQDFVSQGISDLRDLETVAISVSQGIGNSIGNSITDGISGLIEGTAEAEQVFANFLKNIANILIQEGTRMIAMYTAIAIAKAIAGMANYNQSFNTNVPGAQAGSDFGIRGQIIPADAGVGAIAANGAYFANGVAAFAKGGMFTDSVVSSPTLFKFADGSAMKTGLMGEAGPEAIMPLSRNSDGRLGVDASGLREAMGGSSGSSSTPMLNMTFETTSINGVEYVSRDQLEAAMAATRRQATKDGAKQGMNMTLDRLQQSPKTRSRVGLR